MKIILNFLKGSKFWKFFKQVQLMGFYTIEIFYKLFHYNYFKRKNINYKISFCTVCKGRLSDLKETYIKNILDNDDYENCEFVLVNYNSNDGLSNWVKKNLKGYIKSGKLIYYENFNFREFHMAHAKNCSHRLASGEILVNLDADNFTGKGFAKFINDVFNKYAKVIICSRQTNGSSGRTAILRKHYLGCNGYDESFFKYGHEESDLVWRLINKYGLFRYAIKDSKFLSFLDNSRLLEGKSKAELNYSRKPKDELKFYKKNELLMKQHKDNKIFIVNKNGFGKGKFRKNFVDYLRLN